MNNFSERKAFYVNKLEEALNNECAELFEKDSEIAHAAEYSLLHGGKRVRGVLALAVCEMLCGTYEPALKSACAIEMVHAYSIIHDDLPCMDNDDMRRGKPSCHKAFGEATAMLAGDALLTAAFEAVSGGTNNIVQAIKVLSAMAGAKGMIYGQELDLLYEEQKINESLLCEIHKNKTGKLINAAVLLGALSANADEQQQNALSQYAYSIGLTFQIIDDVLDVISNEEILGKPVGSDNENSKNTFVTLKGVEGSLSSAKELTLKACSSIKNFPNPEFLISFAQELLERKK